MRRYWRGLPWDGLGWPAGGDDALHTLRLRASRTWRRSLPFPVRVAVLAGDRLLWPIAALLQSLRFVRAGRQKSGGAIQLYRDCLKSGASPMDAHVWRSLHGGLHPLPQRAAWLLLSRLGACEGHDLLADKLAAAQFLADRGCIFPALVRLWVKGEVAELPAPPLPKAGLFIKPRHGYGGRGCFALTRQDEAWCVDGQPVPASAVQARLTRLGAQDDLLLQERLVATPELSDLAADGRAPVLRLVTVALPASKPFLHAGCLTLAVPGRNPRHFLQGAIHAPIDPATGILRPGILLAEPARRLHDLDQGKTVLSGRVLPQFFQAVDMVLRAMEALPALPLIQWDIILTPDGPVMLEGNTGGDWILANLAGIDGLDSGPLAPVLARWVPAEA